MKKLHFLSGLLLTIFICIHLFNHVYSYLGPLEHIVVMDKFRKVYRNTVVESILLLTVLMQIFSGIKLISKARQKAITTFEKIHIWSGMYLAFFLLFHVSAVMVGRYYLQLDTNFYFGIAGLNTFPANLFFLPYYALAILSFFGHIAAVHAKKMTHNVFGIKPKQQSVAILTFACYITFILIFGLTNHFNGFEIPSDYKILTGQ